LVLIFTCRRVFYVMLTPFVPSFIVRGFPPLC